MRPTVTALSLLLVLFISTASAQSYPDITEDMESNRFLRIEPAIGIDVPLGILALEANVSYRIPRLAYIQAKVGIGMDADLNFPFGTDLLYGFPLIVKKESYTDQLTIDASVSESGNTRTTTYTYYDVEVPRRTTIMPMGGLKMLFGKGPEKLKNDEVDTFGQLVDNTKERGPAYVGLMLGGRIMHTWDCRAEKNGYKQHLMGNSHWEGYIITALTRSSGYNEDTQKKTTGSLFGFYVEYKKHLSLGRVRGAAEIGLGLLPSMGGMFRFMVPIYLP